MIEFSEQRDFSEDALGIDKIVKCSRDLLDGDLLPVLGVKGGDHHTVRANPYRLDKLVLCVNLKAIKEGQTERL